MRRSGIGGGAGFSLGTGGGVTAGSGTGATGGGGDSGGGGGAGVVAGAGGDGAGSSGEGSSGAGGVWAEAAPARRVSKARTRTGARITSPAGFCRLYCGRGSAGERLVGRGSHDPTHLALVVPA